MSAPIVIAESSGIRTEWTIAHGATVVERAFTAGINPHFHSRRDISHIIRLELPETFFRHRWSHVYYYGAGCSSPEKNKTVQASLVAQFRTPVTVMSDLLGAARGLLQHEAGLACIIDTGSNSCHYDGRRIVKNVRAGGFILGDEGSGAALGRLLVGDCFKEVAPAPLRQAFFDHFHITADDVMDDVYNNPEANRNLRAYSFFLAEHLDSPYVHDLVYDELMRFFTRNVAHYDYKIHPVCCMGAIATTYSNILLEVAADFGATVRKIVRSSMPGLITYHAASQNP